MKFRFLLLLLLIIRYARAQEFGGNPPSVKWQQINMPAAKVIFPRGLDSAGERVANIIMQMNGATKPTIGSKQRQISILMQNQTTIANGYVGLAPFRSEFYLTPDQNSFEIGSLWWPEQLAIHEFRHVQQYDNFNVGVSHLMKILFGEGGQALANDLAIPNWFFEGDAVFNETLVSRQGRGRIPYFFNGMRALWADGINYSYMKLRNGSYKDYTPDWYPLGYMLVSYGRDRFGDDFWKNVTHDAAAYRYGFFPLQKAIKVYSGEDFSQFRADAFNHFKQQFGLQTKKDSAATGHHSPLTIHHSPTYTSREYPAFVNDSTLIYMKSDYQHIPVFMLKTGDREKKVAVRSVSIDNYFTYRDGKVVYAAYRPDLRWNYRDYSELMLLDVKTGKERRLTRATKYFSPDISLSGKAIVAAKEGTDGKSALHLLSATDGRLLRIIPNKHKLFYTYPRFYGEGELIAAVRKPNGEMTLDRIDMKTGEDHYLLPFSYQPIAFPTVKGDKVYFSATSDITERLFALNLSTGSLQELENDNLNGSVGNYEPAAGKKKFAWVGFTARGYRLNIENEKDLDWKMVLPAQVRGPLPDFGISALTRDTAADLLSRVKDDSLPVSKYRKSHHLFNFHSLIPDFNDPNYTLSIEGENVLNTLQSQLSFNYNRDEGYKQLGFDAIYGALFPYLSGGADYYFDRRGYHNGGNVYWNETDLHGGFEMPLNLSRGKTFTSLRAGADAHYTAAAFQPAYRSIAANRSYTYLNYYFSFSHSIQQARQNIYPRLAQSIYVDYKSAVSGIDASQFLASGNIYLPGLMINHNLVINLAHQQKSKNGVIDFSNDFPFSRGYIAENLYDMNKAGVNYHFPIAYPDAGFANTFYLMRIRGNVFYDYTRASDFYTNGSKFKSTFRSTGAEIYFDSKWFNQDVISFGFRYSYLVDPDIFGGAGHSRFEFIVPITVF